MSATKRTYETTYEAEDSFGNVTAALELRVVYTFEPGSRDHYDASIGGPGGWSPGDAPEIEIVQILVEDFDGRGKKVGWKEASAETYDALDTWIETTLIDRLIEAATEDRADEKDRAAEYAVE